MENKKLKFSVHFDATLEKAVSCQVGTYYVDVDKKLYYFEPAEGLNPRAAKMTAAVVAAMADMRNIKSAELVVKIYENCDAIKDEYVKKDGDKYLVDLTIEGELEALVSTKWGTLYGSCKHEYFYFESLHPGFLRAIELKKFVEGIHADLEGDDPISRTGAEIVKEILEDWSELDPEDIVKE